jgi:pimeloyl-ACP methyl ester carboxylesterase
MRARLTPSLTVIAVVLGTAVTPAVAAPAPTTTRNTQHQPSALPFGPCPADLAGRFPAMTCATLKVPLDYSRPFGAQISLTVSKMAARDPARRRGSLFVNPGGPGGGGAAYAGSLSTPNANGYTRLPGDVLDMYDVIGMDPRGVEHSAPSITCVSADYFAPPQPDPDAAAARTALWKLWNEYSDGCQAKSGASLPQMGTINVAKDMDRVRAALGDQKLSFFGASYGSWLGAIYGQLFPQRIDRMIIDGLINPEPRQLWYEAAVAQGPGIQGRMEAWFSWAAQYDSVFQLGSTAAQVRTAWNQTLASWRATPHGVVGGNELLYAAYNSMFSESPWIAFAQALSAYVVHGDDSALIEYATPSTTEADERFNAVFNAVICVDANWPRDRATYEQDAAESLANGNQVAWFNMWLSGSACQNWPVPASERPVLDGSRMPRILMMNSLGDPATPYAGALRMHAALPNSVLVTEQGGKHVVFASAQAQANPQANEIGRTFLVSGELPAGDVSVPAHPLPVPTAAALSAPVKPYRSYLDR